MSSSGTNPIIYNSNLIIGFWVTMILMIVISIIMKSMIFELIYHFCRTKSKISYVIQVTAALSLLCAIFSVWSDFIHIEQALSLRTAVHRDTFHVLRAHADFFMFLSLISFFINLYVRLISSFDNTSYALSRAFKAVSLLLLVTGCILDVLYITLVVWRWEQEYVILHAHIYGLFTYFHVLFFVLVVYKFINQLHIIYIGLQYASDGSFTNEVHIDDHTHLISAITKQSLLATISLILFLIRFVYRHVMGYFDEDMLSEYIWFISYVGRDLVLLSMAFYIYLSFKFNRKQYTFCCKHCHKCCESMCILCIKHQTHLANAKAASTSKLIQLNSASTKKTHAPTRDSIRGQAKTDASSEQTPSIQLSVVAHSGSSTSRNGKINDNATEDSINKSSDKMSDEIAANSVQSQN